MILDTKNICPACESTLVSNFATIADHEYHVDFQARYAHCQGCRTIYQTPMPNLQKLASFYPADYHSFESNTVLVKLRHHLRLKRLRSLVASDNITMLDYGCGHGGFLLEAAKYLPQARFYGYEIGQKKEIIRRQENVVIIKGSIDDLLEELPFCDLITMNHVIEHLPQPDAVLQILYGRLKENGVIEGQTPRADSLEHDMFKSLWAGYHAPRHTVVFSKNGLNIFFKRVGFKDPQIIGAFNPAGIAVSLATLRHGNVPSFIPRSGFTWLFYLGLAVIFSPIDLLSDKPGVMDFSAKKIKTHG